jgi:hypothetical protein
MPAQSEKKTISKGKKLKFFFFTLLFLFIVIFVISEIVLSFMNYQSRYDVMKKVSYTQAKWWTCDSVNGPRYVAHQATKEDSVYFLREIWYYKRLMMINNDGYHDKDEFTNVSPDNDSLKILVAGDSFTWGASADIGNSYVDVLQSDISKIQPAIIWNTGIPATGTNHALYTTKKYLPLQKSNYVVLGFYVGNDFGDNILPFDRLVFNKLASCYNQYDLDKDLNPFKISNREAYKKATGSYPMEELNFLQKILVRSRCIAFVSDLKTKVTNRLSGQKTKIADKQYNSTKEYLKQLNDYVKENNAELIVLVIPSLNDVTKKDVNYQNTIKILNELSLKYIDPIDQFIKEDYLTIDGGHWKNSGHTKAGHALSKYLLDYINTKRQKTFKKN